MVKVLIQEDLEGETKFPNGAGPEGEQAPYGVNKKLYQCEACGFNYAEKEQAEKCEAWCKEHNSCNLEITAEAKENKREPGSKSKLTKE